jgi:hypothetical protein
MHSGDQCRLSAVHSQWHSNCSLLCSPVPVLTYLLRIARWSNRLDAFMCTHYLCLDCIACVRIHSYHVDGHVAHLARMWRWQGAVLWSVICRWMQPNVSAKLLVGSTNSHTVSFIGQRQALRRLRLVQPVHQHDVWVVQTWNSALLLHQD